jgi:hypothetical protein
MASGKTRTSGTDKGVQTIPQGLVTPLANAELGLANSPKGDADAMVHSGCTGQASIEMDCSSLVFDAGSNRVQWHDDRRVMCRSGHFFPDTWGALC